MEVALSIAALVVAVVSAVAAAVSAAGSRRSAQAAEVAVGLAKDEARQRGVDALLQEIQAVLSEAKRLEEQLARYRGLGKTGDAKRFPERDRLQGEIRGIIQSAMDALTFVKQKGKLPEPHKFDPVREALLLEDYRQRSHEFVDPPNWRG